MALYKANVDKFGLSTGELIVVTPSLMDPEVYYDTLPMRHSKSLPVIRAFMTETITTEELEYRLSSGLWSPFVDAPSRS